MKEKSSRNGRSRIPWFWALSNILDGPFWMDRFGCEARSFLRDRRGADAWAALPCAPWCTWQFVDEKRLGPQFCSRLAWRRRQSIKMVNGVDACFHDARAGGGGGHFLVAAPMPRLAEATGAQADPGSRAGAGTL